MTDWLRATVGDSVSCQQHTSAVTERRSRTMSVHERGAPSAERVPEDGASGSLPSRDLKMGRTGRVGEPDPPISGRLDESPASAESLRERVGPVERVNRGGTAEADFRPWGVSMDEVGFPVL